MGRGVNQENGGQIRMRISRRDSCSGLPLFGGYRVKVSWFLSIPQVD